MPMLCASRRNSSSSVASALTAVQRNDSEELYEAGRERKPSRVRLGSSADEVNGASGSDKSR